MTGANGFIGSWLVKTLLEDNNGYPTIHASIFPGSDASHLFALPGASSSRLKIFDADLLDADAISAAINGCSGVFHVASPCTLEDPQDPEAELITPAVQGTINVLQAALNSNPPVRRVVLTSSISAMVPNPSWPSLEVMDESSWTDLNYCKSRQVGFSLFLNSLFYFYLLILGFLSKQYMMDRQFFC